MPKRKAVESSDQSGMMRPPLSPEARENQLITLATDLAEKQLREGTASSQLITHYLKLATAREKTEREILELQKELIKAKTKSYQSNEEMKALYADALDAMRRYRGDGGRDED